MPSSTPVRFRASGPSGRSSTTCATASSSSAIRLRRLVAEDDPVLPGYDEGEYARRLHYAERAIGPSLAALTAARAATLDLLECLSEDEWARTGTHTEQGPYSVTAWLRDYAAHPHDHADQVHRVLAAVRGRDAG